MGTETTTPFESLPTDTQEYIKNLRNEAKTNRESVEKLQADLKKLSEDQLTKNQEWQTLAEQRANEIAEYKPFKDQAAQYRSALKAYLDARIAAIPEDKRDLIPEGMDEISLSKWLDKAGSKLMLPVTPKLDANSGGVTPQNGVSTLSPEELDWCKKSGVKPEDYLKTKLTKEGKK